MNKKFYLGAILLGALTLMSGALTSCIENDEPEGIQNLRGAKAELLRAKAEVEKAKVAVEAANAAFINSQAAVNQATADKIKAEIAIVNAQAEYEKARAAFMEAQALQEAAKVDAEVAKAEQQKAAAMQAMSNAELAIEQNKLTLEAAQQQQAVTLQNIKNNLASLENQYDNMMAEFEAAKAVLTPNEAAKVASLEGQVNTAWFNLKNAQSTVLTKMNALFNASNNEQDNGEALEKNLTAKQNDLAALQAVLEELNGLKDASSITEWETEYNALDAEHKALSQKLAEIQVAKDKALTENKEVLHQKDANQQALTDAQNAETKVKTQDKYKTSAIKIEFTNDEVATATGLTKKLEADKAEDTYENLIKDTFAPMAAIKGWEEKVKASVSAEAIQEAECALTAAKEAAAEAAKTHAENVADFKAKHEQMESGVPAVKVDPKKFEEAIANYNKNFKDLSDKVAAYNKTVDDQNAAVAKALETATTAEYNKLVGADELTAQKAEYAKQLGGPQAIFNGNTLFSAGEITAKATIAEIEALVNSRNSDIVNATKTLADAKKLDAAKTIAKVEGSSDYKNALRNTFATVGAYDDYVAGQKEAAATAAKTAKAYTDAVAAQTKAVADAQKAVDDVVTVLNSTDSKKGGYESVKTAISDYVQLAADAAQVQTKDAKKVNADGLTGVDTKYIKPGDSKDIKDADKAKATATEWYKPEVELKKDAASYTATGHLVVVRTAAAEATVKAAEALEEKVDPTLAKTAWTLASFKAFGLPDRHTEITGAKDENGTPVGGSLDALLSANKQVASYEAKIAANADIKKLAEEIAAAKTKLEAEIQVAKDAAKAAEDATKAAKDAYDASVKAVADIEKPFNDQADALKHTDIYKEVLKGDIKNIISAYYLNTPIKYTDENDVTVTVYVSDFETLTAVLKANIKTYKTNVEKAEDAVVAAQKALDRWEANNEFDAVAQAQLDLEQAQYELEVAENKYTFAVDQLNAYLEALAK